MRYATLLAPTFVLCAIVQAYILALADFQYTTLYHSLDGADPTSRAEDQNGGELVSWDLVHWEPLPLQREYAGQATE